MIKKLIKIKTMEIIIYYNFFYNNKKEKNSYKYIFIKIKNIKYCYYYNLSRQIIRKISSYIEMI